MVAVVGFSEGKVVAQHRAGGRLMEHRQRDTPRLVLGRVVVAILVGASALALAGVAGSEVLGSLKHWVNGQKQYETTFAAIALDPPPPAWYRGGSAGFLEHVRLAARRGEAPFSALDLDLAALGRDFRLYHWVRRVQRVERTWPNRIVVRLDYRRPVARAAIPGKSARVLVDADGVILPWDDVDPERAGRLPLISGPDPPFDPRPGRYWMSSDGTTDARLQAAVTLAAFLERALDHAAKPNEFMSQLKVIYSVPKYGLFLENGESTLIYWADAPGAERPGSLTAAQKWEMLTRWLAQRGGTLVHRPHYLAFRKEGVVIAEDKDGDHSR
jgi:hypothetical protein